MRMSLFDSVILGNTHEVVDFITQYPRVVH